MSSKEGLRTTKSKDYSRRSSYDKPTNLISASKATHLLGSILCTTKNALINSERSVQFIKKAEVKWLWKQIIWRLQRDSSFDRSARYSLVCSLSTTSRTGRGSGLCIRSWKMKGCHFCAWSGCRRSRTRWSTWWHQEGSLNRAHLGPAFLLRLNIREKPWEWFGKWWNEAVERPSEVPRSPGRMRWSQHDPWVVGVVGWREDRFLYFKDYYIRSRYYLEFILKNRWCIFCCWWPTPCGSPHFFYLWAACHVSV